MKYFSFLIIFLTFQSGIFGQNRREKKIIDLYLQVSNQKIGTNYMPLMKWNRDSIGYYIYGKMKGMTKKKWNRFLSKIEKLSGLHFYQVSSNEEAQILIYFGKITEYFKYDSIDYKFKINPEWISWSSRDYDFSFGLKKASFCIDKDEIHDFNKIRYLVKQNFLNALGLFAKIKKDVYLLSDKYSYKNRNFKLTKMDKACIAIHYSDVINSGMKKEAVKYVLNANNIVTPILKKAK